MLDCICIVEASKFHYFKEYLTSLNLEIRFYPCLINKGERILVVQKVLDLNYEDASWLGILNTEQLTRDEWCLYFKTTVSNLKYKFEIFDYSIANIKILKEQTGIVSHHLPYKYRKEEIDKLKMLINNTPKIYDVAFVGGINHRRHNILNTMKDISIYKISDKWGDDRDMEIAKCKVLINIHYENDYTIFEEIRCVRWQMAGMTVISERSLYDDETSYKENLILTDDLNQTVMSLIS